MEVFSLVCQFEEYSMNLMLMEEFIPHVDNSTGSLNMEASGDIYVDCDIFNVE